MTLASRLVLTQPPDPNKVRRRLAVSAGLCAGPDDPGSVIRLPNHPRSGPVELEGPGLSETLRSHFLPLRVSLADSSECDSALFPSAYVEGSSDTPLESVCVSDISRSLESLRDTV